MRWRSEAPIPEPNMNLDQTLAICVAGNWRLGQGERYASLYPASGEPIAWLHAASLADVEEAIAGADAAFRHSGWAQRKPHERAAVLHRVAAIIRERAEELAQLQRLDNGKPIAETRNLVASAAATFQFFAAACETLEDTITPMRGDSLTMSVHEPMGVVAAITPWNSPIASEAQKLAPALAAGNAVVVKPAEVTPLLALELARICEQAGVPKGMVSVLPGKGSVIGDAITRHALVKRVSFTGGTATGKHIAHIAADKMMPLSLELGGKSPTMVFEDADIEHAVAGVLYGIFSSSGESCIAGSRLFVAHSIYDSFMEKLAAGAAALRVGDPADERTQVGPLITARHRDSIESYVAMGVADGGRLRTGGMRPQGAQFERGNYYLPTIIEGVTNSQRICQQEIFGPVLVAMQFSDEQDLIAQANDSVYALAAGIWTSDYKRAWRIGRAVQAGNVWINTYKQFSIATPFGGWRDSGLGREKGRLGILQYMEQKSMYWGLNDEPLPWAK
jgi:aldehyde dehydrogenase (NAD+)